jgi:hypothetical protein
MAFRNGHAVLIGVGSYAHAPQLDVPITVDDARAVAAVLRDPQYCGYPPEQVTLLNDDAASRDRVLAAFDALAARVAEDDTVLIFFAGHGAYGDDGYYLTTQDTRLSGGRVVPGSGLREGELIARLRTIKARRMVLLVNACHAGELAPVLGTDEASPSGAPLPSSTAAALLGTGSGRIIISACRENQVAYIGPGPLSLFGQALVDGLCGKGVSSNRGYISVFDLYIHLYFALDEAVPRLVSAGTRRRYGERQEPELTILKGVGPFALALYRGAAPLGGFVATAALPEGTAVRAVSPAYSEAMLRQYSQQIGDNAQIGVNVVGDVHGPITVTQQARHGPVDGSHASIDTMRVGEIVSSDDARHLRLQTLLEQLRVALRQVSPEQATVVREAVEQFGRALTTTGSAALDTADIAHARAQLQSIAENLATTQPEIAAITSQIAAVLRR